MKKYLLLLGAVAFLAACNNEKKEGEEKEGVADEAPAMTMNLPYTPTYSSSFKMGDPAHATTIVQGSWKDWETNNLDNMKSWIADTIVAYHSDNIMIRGADSLMARWKRGRATYSNVIDTINAVMSVYSTDKKENWVMVWAKEINTKTDGKIDTVMMMETWRMNKDGKADMLLQFDRATRKK